MSWIIIVREENVKKKNSVSCLPAPKSRRNMGNKICYMMYSIYMYIPTFRTCFNSLRALRTELFRDQFHIADSSSFFFKGCKIIGTITKVPLYSIKVTGVVLGPYQLWRRMFGSEAVVFQPDGGWRSSYFNTLLTWNWGCFPYFQDLFERKIHTLPSSNCFLLVPKMAWGAHFCDMLEPFIRSQAGRDIVEMPSYRPSLENGEPGREVK